VVDEQVVQDAFQRMAGEQVCPRCRHVGFDLEWVKPDKPSFPIGGTTLGYDKIPRMECRGCHLTVDGNMPR
jgi:hypothetical protein